MEQKKSPLVPILIIVTVVLFIGVGVLVFFLVKGGNEDNAPTPTATVAPPDNDVTADKAEATDNGGGTDDGSNADDDASETDPSQKGTDGEPEQGGSMESYAGTYKMVAAAYEGHFMDARGADTGSGLEIILNADGTGIFRMISGGNSEDKKVTWKLEGENVRFLDEKTGTDFFEGKTDDASFTMKDGLLWYNVSGGTTVLARDGADLSGLDLLTPEEFYEKYGDELKKKKRSGEY